MCVVDELAHTNARGQPPREALSGRARAAGCRHRRDDGRQHPAPGDAERRGEPGDRRPRARDGARHVPRSRGRDRQRRRRRSRSCTAGCGKGKVYKPEKVEQALANFFREANISTLRELALRAVADEVGDRAASRRQREGLEPALIPERVMVCVSSSADAPRVLRAGARIAGAPRRALVRGLRGDAARGAGHIKPQRSRDALAAEHRARRGARRDRRPRARPIAPADGLIAFAKREGITHVIFGQIGALAVGDPAQGLDAEPLPRRGPGRGRPGGLARWLNRRGPSAAPER